ncbi:MAG: restriction endonuclease subunit S [Desulfovermiculus sp.]|nr:restriction endonuclease subunit S [Desulfovermiculus sp.]
MAEDILFEHFDLLADTPGGVQKLRELILQLAVQGKLVPQNPEDAPASELLKEIEAEKQRLVKEGKIKKQKPLPEINPEEVPFELPEGWEWARLGDITSRIGSGSTPRGGKNAYVESGVPFLRSQNIWNEGLHLENIAYIPITTHQKMAHTKVLSGDILLNITGASLGRCTLYPNDLGEANVSQHVTIIRPIDYLTRLYLHIFILSPYAQSLIWGRQVGMAREGLSKKVLQLFEIPLPPLSEQHRIVAKVDQLMDLCGDLEAKKEKQKATHARLNKSALQAFRESKTNDEMSANWPRVKNNFRQLFTTPESVQELRSTILQLAVQGKLVPQNPQDEPASALLERIREEKQRLVKEGKIKKQKPLPEIKPEEVPFELPEGWEWCRFVDLGTFGRGKSKHRPRNDLVLYENGDIPVVQTGDIARANGHVKTYTGLYNKKGLTQSMLWPKGTLCITIAANIADSGILSFDACFPDSVVGFIPSECIGYSLYFDYFIRTVQQNLLSYAPSTAQKNINLGILNQLLIPLPPLSEMNRIVVKVDQFMTLCGELESRFSQSQADGEKLMAAILTQLSETNASQVTSVQPKNSF